MHMHVAVELHMLCRSAYARRRRSHRRRHAGNALCYVDAGSDVALRSCCCCCVGERRREYVCESTKCMCMCECSSSSSSRARTSQQTHTHMHTSLFLSVCLAMAVLCCAAAVDVGWRRRVVARKNIFNEPTESTACNSSNQFELKREAVNMF